MTQYDYGYAYEYAFSRVGGNAIDDGWFVATRALTAEQPWEEWESFLMTRKGEAVRVLRSGNCRMVSTWRAPSGKFFVAEWAGEYARELGQSSGVFVGEPLESGAMQWSRQDTGSDSPRGVWGLDEHHVYAWGGDQLADGRRLDRGVYLWRFDGRCWHDHPAPPGHVSSIRGLSSDSLFAVGRHGAYRWDGSAWRGMELPNTAKPSHLLVVSDQEVYACGVGGFFQGSVYGWTQLSPQTFGAIAYWRGHVWLGSAAGLFRYGREDGLVQVLKERHVRGIHAGEGLMVTTTRAILEGRTLSFALHDEACPVRWMFDRTVRRELGTEYADPKAEHYRRMHFGDHPHYPPDAV